MPSTLSTLTTVIWVWLFSGLTFFGIGLTVHWLGRRLVRGWHEALLACWLGWACTIVYLQIWHLFHAIDEASAVVPIAVGAAGLFASMRRGAQFFGRVGRPQLRVPSLLLATLGLIWLAALTLGRVGPYDAGLYHLQTVTWLNAYPVVPGLGDLHGRLAFNSSFFLYSALLNVGPLSGQAPRLANGLLAVLLLAQLATASIQLIKSRGGGSASDYLRTLLLLPTLAFLGDETLANTSPDMAVFLLEIVVAAELVDLLVGGPAEASGFVGFRLALLIAAGVVVKLSFASFGIGCLLLTVWSLRQRVRAIAVMAAIFAAVLVPWMFRGVLLSGYPVYPTTLGGLPVDWRISAQAATLEAEWILGWARDPGPDALASLQTWSWLGPWFVRVQGWLFPFILLAIASSLVGAVSLRGVGQWTNRASLLLIPVGVGLLGWFVLTPDPRFVGALMWLAGVIPALYVRFQSAPAARLRAVGLIAAVAVVPGQMLALATFFALPILNLAADPAQSALPVAQLATVTTDAGLQIYVPTQGDQAWDAPLPSTPYPNKHLETRCPGTFSCGFRLEPDASAAN